MKKERHKLATVSASGSASSVGRAEQPAWTEELRRSITSVAELAERLALTEDEREGALRAERAGLPIAVTPYYLSLADPRDPGCPIRRQCVPHIAEERTIEGDMVDPLGERAHEVAPDLVCRYPDRALLLVSDRCSVYCRFCTRSRMVGAGGGVRTLEHLAPAFAWLAAHPVVRDVIVRGGDPLVMTSDRLVRVLAELRAIPSIETLRLATRVPVTLPSRITAELVEALRAYHPIWVMTHFNHPKELTPMAEAACLRLVDAGFPVMNQTVLLRGINDDRATLETLFRGLVRWRVRPYYLLQTDPVRGTGHLRTPIETGLRVMEELQGRLSGIALPKLIVDTPGGLGKVPILPNYVVRRSAGRTVLRTFRGVEVEYVDPPPAQQSR